MNILLYLWQLPQNIIGFILSRKREFVGSVEQSVFYPVYYKKNFFNSGVCLGDYIILDYSYSGKSNRNAQKHEYGHHKQSVYLGWLYLIIIGLPSLICNIYDRFFHKNWTRAKRRIWYYNLPFELWADNLGGVKR